MKYAVISDIHSNLEALNAVIEDLGNENVDGYLCPGDIIGYGADPNECTKIVSGLRAGTAAGNHDFACVDKFDIFNFNENAKAALIWTKKELDQASRAFFEGLETVYTEERMLSITHGSLDEPLEFNYMFGPYEAARSFREMNTDILFVGHTHVPAVFGSAGHGIEFNFSDKVRLEAGTKYIINAGSVGQPRDRDPRACYVIFDSDEMTVEYKRIRYDIKKNQGKILEAGLPEYLARRLKVGT